MRDRRGGRRRPVTSRVKVPVILTGAAETASGPLAEIHGRARQALAAEPALWDVSILNVFPFADDVGMGQAVLALTDGEAAPGQRIARDLGELPWSWRDRFPDPLPDLAAALPLVAEQPAARPFPTHDLGRQVLPAEPSLWDVSILIVFPFADDAGMGQAGLALTDGEAAPGQRIAEALGELLWSWRDRFRDQLPDIAAALDLVAAQPAARPFAIADMGDRVLAGVPGDSTAILAAALAHPDRLRSEEHTSELQSLMRISYAVC